MKLLTGMILLSFLAFCGKKIEVNLPAYHPEVVVEMYLEEGKPLRCLLSESLPYTDTAINRPLNHATIVFSDGSGNDTLQNLVYEDTVTGRWYNYYHPKILKANPAKTYSIRITDGRKREVTGTTRFSQDFVRIDSIVAKPSSSNTDSFSVGVVISDPEETQNYYRFLVAKKMNDFSFHPANFFLSDISFNGKPFSFFSDADYARKDTVSVRVYTLLKEHYDYIQSTSDARGSNFNPFSQPGRIKSNVRGGLGIFTAIRFDHRELVIK